MSEVVTLAFNRKRQTTEEKQAQLNLLSLRVFTEVYDGDLNHFIRDMQHECRSLKPSDYKRWLQTKLQAQVVQKSL